MKSNTYVVKSVDLKQKIVTLGKASEELTNTSDNTLTPWTGTLGPTLAYPVTSPFLSNEIRNYCVRAAKDVQSELTLDDES